MLTFKKIAAVAAMTALTAAATLSVSSAQAAIPIQHWTLPNGAKVYLGAVSTLPIVDVQLDFDAGSRRDPDAQAGLAGVTADMVEKGIRAVDGAPAMDQNALGEAWADLGAEFNVGAGGERTSFALRSLSDPKLLDKAVALAARVIGEPEFPDDVWQRERERLSAAIKEANTKPGVVAARNFAHAVYGSNPLGQETDETTLARIDVATMRARYAALMLPCRAKLSIVGAVTRAQADAIATALLARLPQTATCAALPI
ncbi:MAG: insulinase family protein, partial [Variovorax sp.]|nr:insulinase family protein [Variovorax sp.]